MMEEAGSRLRRSETVGARSVAAAAVGLVAGGLASLVVIWQAALLVGWDAAAAFDLAWTWWAVARMTPAEARSHAKVEDPSRSLAEAIILASGVVLLAAVGLLLIKAGQAHGGTKAYLISIGVVSVILSWATVHTLFTLRYARSYYSRPEGGIDFNEKEPPTYLDFAYLSFTIGMTFQVSDTDLTDKPIRRLALSHALLSYLFGAVILALSINVVASLLS
jgi:uncharacterized membrane protein